MNRAIPGLRRVCNPASSSPVLYTIAIGVLMALPVLYAIASAYADDDLGSIVAGFALFVVLPILLLLTL